MSDGIPLRTCIRSRLHLHAARTCDRRINTHTTYYECSGAAALTCKGIPYVVKTGNVCKSTALYCTVHYSRVTTATHPPVPGGQRLAIGSCVSWYPWPSIQLNLCTTGGCAIIALNGSQSGCGSSKSPPVRYQKTYSFAFFSNFPCILFRACLGK